MDIREVTIDLFLTLVFFDILAERTVALLHVLEFILILDKELLATVALCDRNIGDHVFVVLLWIARVELPHIYNKYFLVTQTFEHSLVKLNRAVSVWRKLGVHPLEHPSCEQVVFQAVIIKS